MSSQNSRRTSCDIFVADGQPFAMGILRHRGRERVKASTHAAV